MPPSAVEFVMNTKYPHGRHVPLTTAVAINGIGPETGASKPGMTTAYSSGPL